MGFSDFSLFFAISAIVLSAFVHAAFGFGFPMLATPLLAIQSNVQNAILFSLFPTIVVNLITLLYRRDGGPSVFHFAPLAAYSVIGTLFGTQLLINFSPEPFRLFLALIILLYLFKEKLAMHKITWIKEHQTFSMLIFGLLAGLVSGTTNIMIPVLLIYLTEIEVERNLMIRVMNLCFFSAKITQVGQFTAAGLLDTTSLIISILLSLAATIAILVGFRFRVYISNNFYDVFLKFSLYIMAFVLIFQFLASHLSHTW